MLTVVLAAKVPHPKVRQPAIPPSLLSGPSRQSLDLYPRRRGMLHGLLPYYAERADPSVSGAFLSALATDTGDDLDWLDRQIKEVGTRYLVDDTVTAAGTSPESRS